jgi:hypothetical protein
LRLKPSKPQQGQVKLTAMICIFLPAIASDQQRPASGQTELLKYRAMVSGNIIDDLGEIKGVRCG